MYTICTPPFCNERTDSDIIRYLALLNAGNASVLPMSWRRIAAMPGLNGINPTTLSAYAKGRPIKNQKHRAMLGLQLHELAPVCPVHGKACVLDCVNQKAVAIDAQIKDPPQPPRHLRRFTVYPGTDSAKIADGLLRVTGVRWVPVEDEIKY